MSREQAAVARDEDDQQVSKPWPRCYTCGKPEWPLCSYVLRGERMGFALCRACLAIAKQENGDDR